ncbi:DUF5947 family protein [Conexibacter stalactiti]|uniref:DUF5947 family protein n=1 Tax=Conexibacter stalactiti TaxID=1940611 RepID=A0ABU4HKU6_9ACTN|nr:DUF5947 family protein [Conexibacter stalactiti]MDW5593865.1 DUF5947 family protein [Conexibacter stalactiti]MEC5034507.1 DUF5947 family protein [Conexibacter stalactiti]
MAVSAGSEQALAERVQELTARLEELEDPAARDRGRELAAAVAALYGDGLERIFAVLGDDELSLAAARERLLEDGVVASLLLLHGLYPIALEQRVAEALDSVRPYLESHGGGIELLALEEGVARLRLRGSCDGCAASAATLEAAVEHALQAAAPDLLGIDVEGAVAPAPARPPAGSPAWRALDAAAQVPRGALALVADGLVVANVAGTLLAYRDACAACGEPLHGGMLVGGTLTCVACGCSYDLPRAGRSRDGDALQLAPVPLLRGGGTVKVAFEGAASEAPGGARAEGRGAKEEARCGLCPSGLSDGHRHLLHLYERRIVCVCETCWSLHSGDEEYRPAGVRTLWLDDFELPDELWAALQIPIGLAFAMRSSMTGQVVALYPSPAGATEAEVDLLSWAAIEAVNPVLQRLEPDAEALVVNRLPGAGGGDGGQYAIAPIDDCYRLVGLIKSRWQGISGGDAIDDAVREFFAGLRERAAA